MKSSIKLALFCILNTSHRDIKNLYVHTVASYNLKPALYTQERKKQNGTRYSQPFSKKPALNKNEVKVSIISKNPAARARSITHRARSNTPHAFVKVRRLRAEHLLSLSLSLVVAERAEGPRSAAHSRFIRARASRQRLFKGRQPASRAHSYTSAPLTTTVVRYIPYSRIHKYTREYYYYSSSAPRSPHHCEGKQSASACGASIIYRIYIYTVES